MKLVVALGASAEASFDIHLYDTAFVKKYINELEWCLLNCEFNQHEAFASFCSAENIKQALINACATINKYLPNFITVTDSESQDYYNYLHTKFEQLSGTFGKPTKLFAIANNELKQAIRNLNFFVHRAEINKDPYPALYISFNKNQYRRKPLEPANYTEFDFKFNAGTLFLHYVELGKDFNDLYKDNLPIDYAGTKNLHYYSGESWLTFNDFDAFSDPGYVTWLANNNIDQHDKKLGHGKIPLGYIKEHTVAQLLNQYRYINHIKINYE